MNLNCYQERAAFYAAFFFFSLLAVSLLTGCQNAFKEQLEHLAKNSELNQPVLLPTHSFTLLGWGKNKNTLHANIYIEGDGQAWEDPWTVSADPTPLDPVGFKLAVADSRSNSIFYLARPCQYVMDKRCTFLDWTSGRYSQKVISAYLQALDQIRTTWNVKTFALHGYSGGATIALLVAASRPDVTSIVTFAPLLDPYQWVKYHDYSPLSGSLSPLGQATKLRHIPQLHFIGLDDQQVPLSVSTGYFVAIPESPLNIVHKIPDFNHHSDWPGLWKSYIMKGMQF
jgi:hypothetical protein